MITHVHLKRTLGKSFIYFSRSSNVVSPAMQNTIPCLHIFHFILLEVRLIHVWVVPVLHCYANHSTYSDYFLKDLKYQCHDEDHSQTDFSKKVAVHHQNTRHFSTFFFPLWIYVRCHIIRFGI
jgi:hypothetical protein